MKLTEAVKELEAWRMPLEENRISRHDLYKLDIILSRLKEAAKEQEKISEELADIKETYAHIVNDECGKDEKHCTCVPALRAEIARLKAQATVEGLRAHIKAYINGLVLKDNQTDDGYVDREDVIRTLDDMLKMCPPQPEPSVEPLAVLADRKGRQINWTAKRLKDIWEIWFDNDHDDFIGHTYAEAELKARQYLNTLPDKEARHE